LKSPTGQFNPGKATGRTPLSVIAFGDGDIKVFWRDLNGEVVFDSRDRQGHWADVVTIPGIGPGYQLSALQWDNGEKLRVYYQKFTGTLAEYCSDDGGQTWHPGDDPI
jgi:Neuraminidase (sialidase)